LILLAAAATTTTATDTTGLSINLFWVIVAAGNFIIFLALIWRFGFDPIARILAERTSRIERGLADAEEARRQLAAAAAEHERVVSDARSEAAALVAAAQKSADEARAADIEATRAELGRLRDQAAAEIALERDRALADLRGRVADLALAAAARVVGETMTGARQHRLVEEFLRDEGTAPEGKAN
jgi:F-type H+-transporting ATPase subunit b